MNEDAAWGRRTPVFDTNPYVFGAPRRGDPLVVDSSSSATAFVNPATAAAEGRAIPEGWALDAEGRPTTDPAAGMAGSIAPAGGHKGAALALMVEVLAAGLAGANWSHEASSLGSDEGGPPRLGQTFLAIRPDAVGAAGFAERLETMLAAMTREPGTRVPGDRRHPNRGRAEREGVEVDDALLGTLRDLGIAPIRWTSMVLSSEVFTDAEGTASPCPRVPAPGRRAGPRRARSIRPGPREFAPSALAIRNGAREADRGGGSPGGGALVLTAAEEELVWLRRESRQLRQDARPPLEG